MAEIPIIGGPKQPSYKVMTDEGVQEFPCVMVAVVGDVALGVLMSNFRSVLRGVLQQELDARGLAPIISTASDGPKGDT